MIKRYKQNEIDELAEILKRDGVISAPTDTVYGVCARISSKKAYDNLIKVKERPKNKLFPVMCADVEQIKSVAVINKKAEKIIDAFMPGPITIILKKNESLPEYVNNGNKTIAIRMATSDVLQELIKKTESPVFMSSANRSGKQVCSNLDEIEKECPLLDAMMEGNILFGRASTIVDCSSEFDDVKILREGPITKEQIKKNNV